jgi:CheY-like chemotaxis protein
MLILIVEDSANDRRLMKTIIEHHNHEVLEATNGTDALQLLGQRLPDLIISDAVMPGMDGFELLRRVKQQQRLATVPFIFYSAVYTGFNEVNLALSMGAMAYLEKPQDRFTMNRRALKCSSVATARLLPPSCSKKLRNWQQCRPKLLSASGGTMNCWRHHETLPLCSTRRGLSLT